MTASGPAAVGPVAVEKRSAQPNGGFSESSPTPTINTQLDKRCKEYAMSPEQAFCRAAARQLSADQIESILAQASLLAAPTACHHDLTDLAFAMRMLNAEQRKGPAAAEAEVSAPR